MPEILIRNARFTDIPSVLDIESEHGGSWTYNQFLSELGHSFSFFIVAESDGSVVGYLIAWRAADELQLNNIAVKISHRKQGIGKTMISELINSNTDNIFSSIYLEVRSMNNDAIRFYSDNGFTKTGLRKRYYNDDDAVLMEKKL